MRIILMLVLTAYSLSGCATRGPEPEGTPAFEEILKIDLHAHIFEYIPGFAEVLSRNNLCLLNICVPGSDPVQVKWMEETAELLYQNYGSLHPFASTFPLEGLFEPDYAAKTIFWLDKSFEQGAVMTKIWKEVGMEVKTPGGEFLMPDDPVFDPIYAHLAKRGKPLIAHLAEPISAWLPLEPRDTVSYYARNPEWHFYGKPGVPGYEQIIQARDNILKKHPDLIFIGAHLGSMSHDVEMVAERLEKHPNFFVEIGGRTGSLARQPKEKVLNFFIRFSDRIMYGTDIARVPGKHREIDPEKREEFFEEVLARYRTDYKYYAGQGTMKYRGREVECLGLPRAVLEKLYSGNARWIIPGLDKVIRN